MDEYQKQFAQFNADVSKHTVTVLRADGLYRHLRCSDGSYCMQFDVVTWPGYLCYSGDMGCFVFTRLPDMFELFRGRRGARIDRDYLAEKAVAVDKIDGLRSYSEQLFLAAVKGDYEQYADSLNEDERRDLWRDVEMDVLPAASDGHVAAVEAAQSFTYAGANVFTDFHEHRLEEYTPRFWWCCYAIAWAIERYDARKSEEPASDPARLTDLEPGTTPGSAEKVQTSAHD